MSIEVVAVLGSAIGGLISFFLGYSVGRRATHAQAIAATLGTGTCKRVMDSIDPFAMWVCDHCGHPLDTSENFCGGCGRKVVNA